MSAKIPEAYADLLRDDVKAIAFLATIMKDGTPQVTPVWFNWDGEDLLINSAQGRVKDRNMRRSPFVAATIIDPKNPGRYLQVRGRVVEITTEGAMEHVEKLAMKYIGKPFYAGEPTEVRVIYRVKPERISASG